jgi:hypothetical protein
MSLQTRPIPPIPEMTTKIARRTFRKGNVYMQMRDILGTFFSDDQFADPYPADGQPAYAPWRPALRAHHSRQGDGRAEKSRPRTRGRAPAGFQSHRGHAQRGRRRRDDHPYGAVDVAAHNKNVPVLCRDAAYSLTKILLPYSRLK